MLNPSQRLESDDNLDERGAYTYEAVSVSKAMLGKVPGLGQAKRFVASCIIRPIGKFRGHDRSASLKSN